MSSPSMLQLLHCIINLEAQSMCSGSLAAGNSWDGPSFFDHRSGRCSLTCKTLPQVDDQT